MIIITVGQNYKGEKMDKDKRKKRVQALLMVAVVLVFWNIMQMSGSKKQTKVACVGDSITYGTGVEERKDNCYPVQLQKLLGTKEYRVGNFGVNGATLQKSGDQSFWKEEKYELSLSYDAKIVILFLGTNDSKEINWKDEAAFRKDYEEMIKTYQELETKPQVILVTPPPVFSASEEMSTNMLMHIDILEKERQIIQDIGKEKKLSVIDMYGIMQGHPEWFDPDGIHPNKDGATQIAESVAKAIQNK